MVARKGSVNATIDVERTFAAFVRDYGGEVVEEEGQHQYSGN